MGAAVRSLVDLRVEFRQLEKSYTAIAVAERKKLNIHDNYEHRDGGL